jgi:hypothetical protein
MDFRYLAQRDILDASTLVKITEHLDEFHRYKHHIIAAGARQGGKNKPIKNFCIPKLELMHSVAPSVQLVGPSQHWSADITEHCHITHIKDPARAGNNKNLDIQICRELDREEKACLFDLSAFLHRANASVASALTGDFDAYDSEDYDSDIAPEQPRFFIPTIQPPRTPRKAVDHFIGAHKLLHSPPHFILRPLRTFASASTAFHLNNRASKT